MPVKKRVGPLPEGHPLAGGKTIMFGVGKPTVQKKQESTTTHEERAILNAIAYWNYLQQQRLEGGLPLQSQEEFHEYMMSEKAKYYASLGGEK